MAERWQQWMPFHIDRWRGSAHVQAMRAAARAGYLYLLASAWQSDDCSLPAEDEDLQVLAGVTEEEWKEYGARILRRFSRRGDGRYVNQVLLDEWRSAKAVYEKRHKSFDEVRRSRSAAGKLGAERRWSRRDETSEARYEPGGAGAVEYTRTACSSDGKAMAFAIATDSSAIAGDALQEQPQEQTQERPEPLADAAAPAGPVFLSLPLLGQRKHVVTEADMDAYQQAYPAVDVRAELRKILPWLDANPDKRSRTLQGSKQRIVRWLNRAQDWGGSRGSHQQHSDRGRSERAQWSAGTTNRGRQRVEQALEELARAGVRVPVRRAEAGAGEVCAAAGGDYGCDSPGVLLQGYR